MNNSSHHIPTSFNDICRINNKEQIDYTNYKNHEDIINNDTSVLLIGDSKILTELKDELEKNYVNVFLIEKLSEKFIMRHLFKVNVIITCFDTLELTMNTIKNNDILKSLFIPVIVYSHLNSPFSRKVSYLHGVNDYIPTSVDMYEAIIRINNQIDRKKQHNSYLFLDELTGAYNRRYLSTVFSQHILLNKSFTFVLLDFDNFRRINNEFSYIIGDNVLKAFVKMATKFLSYEDIIVRLGGDEFVLLLPSTSLQVAKKKVTHLLNELSTMSIELDENKFYCTFSAGVVEVTSTINLETVINQTQILLRQSKKKGKNQVCTMQDNIL